MKTLLTLGWLFASGLAALPQDGLYFLGPDGAKEEDLQKAAKALQARCEAYGYSGMVAKVVEREVKSGKVKAIQVTCDTGVNNQMTPNIVQLSLVPGNSITIRAERELKGAEKEQFSDGKSCPKGSTRFQYLGCYGDQFDLGLTGPIILCDDPDVKQLKTISKGQKSKGWYLEMSEKDFEALVKASGATTTGGGVAQYVSVYAVVDGSMAVRLMARRHYFDPDTSQMVDVKKPLCHLDNKILRLSLQNPMPFALKGMK